MRYLKILVFTVLVSSASNAIAQKDNAQKILGCWVFKKVEFFKKEPFEKELQEQTEHTIVCFDANGKFSTTKPDITEPVTGTYRVSADGTTISQQRDLQQDGVDDDAAIAFPDERTLTFTLEFGTMYFERK